MLYLEDYLEMIEHLPQELRDRFTEMREMDLSVQNNMDTIEQKLQNLFNSCRHAEISDDQRISDFDDIVRSFEKTAEEADEKVVMAAQMCDLVNRYIKKLDSELHKFKCELEADNKGVTEVLEKRALERDNITTKNNSSHYKENRYRARDRHRVHPWSAARGGHTTPAAVTVPSNESAIQAALNRDTYVLSTGNLLATAANRAISAAQQQNLPGRRTASLKASYEVVSAVDQHAIHHDHGHGPSTVAASYTAPTAHAAHTTHTAHAPHTTHTTSTATKRHKHKKSYATSGLSTHVQSLASTIASRSSSPTLVDANAVQNNVTIEEPVEEEWTYDPNEPRYCICNQVSYGDMVACDNQHCPFEWFHYPCVGITAPPKGKWYCPQCQTNVRKNRAHRKN